MTKRCNTSTGSRIWTTEGIAAYLDWSSARIEAQVATGGNLSGNQRIVTCDVWRRVERDIEE
jgi:hypothetical protein